MAIHDRRPPTGGLLLLGYPILLYLGKYLLIEDTVFREKSTC